MKTVLSLSIDTEEGVVLVRSAWPPGMAQRSAPPPLTGDQRVLAIRLAHEALGTKAGQLAARETEHGLELRRGAALV